MSDKDSNNITPYSSALYSSSSNLRSRSEQSVRKSAKNEYFLSVLIESDQDEGIYQCINPDMPSLILKNATVLLSSNFFIVFILFKILFFLFLKEMIQAVSHLVFTCILYFLSQILSYFLLFRFIL